MVGTDGSPLLGFKDLVRLGREKTSNLAAEMGVEPGLKDAKLHG